MILLQFYHGNVTYLLEVTSSNYNLLPHLLPPQPIFYFVLVKFKNLVATRSTCMV